MPMLTQLAPSHSRAWGMMFHMHEPPSSPAPAPPGGTADTEERRDADAAGARGDRKTERPAGADPAGAGHRRHKGPCGPECTDTPPLQRWRALTAPMPDTEEILPYDPELDETNEDDGA